MIGARTRLLRNPEFARVGSELEEHVETWFRSCGPADLIGLFDSVSISLLKEAFSHVGGCEGTIWLADLKKESLVVVYNSGDQAETLIGFEQPVGSGIVSMVFSQQQPYCENNIKGSSGHDDTLDRKIAKHTTAMIAVPFYFAFGLRGVISCVQLEEMTAEGDRDGFSSGDVEILARVSNVMERLANESILSSALGLSDVG
ncbi:MAG: GAF domain-containing protein [Verrucomicrobiales bacterium]|nr:GAF domain-containing protein [Verrucomicrobiales bacterium]